MNKDDECSSGCLVEFNIDSRVVISLTSKKTPVGQITGHVKSYTSLLVVNVTAGTNYPRLVAFCR